MGEVVRLEDDDQAVRELFRRLRNRYVLSFPPPEGSTPGAFHRIVVELTPQARMRSPKAVVSHRLGYYFR